jgi:hypothetical protein
MLIKDVVVANAYPLFVRWHACADNAADDAEHEQAKKLFFASARVSVDISPLRGLYITARSTGSYPIFGGCRPRLWGNPPYLAMG